MRQGKLLFLILSLVGVKEVVGQTWSASGSYSNLGSGSVNAGIGLTTVPIARLHVSTTSGPSAIFQNATTTTGVGRVAIGGLSTSFSSSLLPSELLHVRDGNMWIQRGTLRVSYPGFTGEALLVSNGKTTLVGGVYVGQQGPGSSASMEYNTSQAYFELSSKLNVNNYQFKIGSIVNGVDLGAPVLSSLNNMVFRTNSGVNTGSFNFKFMSGNTDLATISNTGNFGIGTAPSTLLHLKGLNAALRIEPQVWAASGDVARLELGDVNNFLQCSFGQPVKINAFSDIVFSNGFNNATVERARINDAGKMSIGTFPIATANPDLNDATALGTLDVNGHVVVRGDLVLKTSDGSRKIKRTNNSMGQRALVSGSNDELIINFQGDFEGGVIIQSRVDIGGMVYLPTTDATVKLGVAGTVVAQKLKCTAVNNWGDFVFDNNYPLQPLNEIEKYVQQHKHLPNIPSATELEAGGIDTGEMLRLQMIKIEELTLHLIEMRKEMIAMKKKN